MDHKTKHPTQRDLVPSRTPGGSIRYLLRTGQVVLTRAEAARELKSLGHAVVGNTQLVLIRESKIVETIGEPADWVDEVLGTVKDSPMDLVAAILAGTERPTITESQFADWTFRSTEPKTPPKSDPMELVRRILKSARS